ncbi:pentatricopeptide repeat-containing protein At3g18020 isoform X3 [Vitis riparia]|uniref:pentatricopeptide repeat-containing protein At3g18020 isoform X3 n=1 Tax=Vitis riparia TaxID=96939 RepID=UPI00155B2FB6|nr:pentatricopeptide repeat-containing protein At3g18020 isoform X3 [Vitis riparia]
MQFLICMGKTIDGVRFRGRVQVPQLPSAANTLPLAFFFSAQSTPNQQHEEEKEEESIINKAFWSRKIHNLCTRDRNVDEALRLLDLLRLRGYRPDSLNLSSIIHALCDANRFSEAHHRFLLSFASHCVPDQRTCNVLIARLLDSRTPHATLHVFRGLIAVRPEFVPSLINYNRLIHQLCSFSQPNEAHGLFFDMRSRGHCPNAVSYTTLIDGYCKIGEETSAWKLFDEMLESGVVPNSLTYSVLLKGVLCKRDVERGRELMCKLWQKMMDENDPSVNNAAFANLIDSLCKEGFFLEVFRIAEDMPQGKSVSEEFAYGQMIDSLCRCGRNHGASRIVYIMRKRGFFPSLVSYNYIVHGLSKEGGCMRAYQLLKEGVEFGFMMSEHTYKVLLEALCRDADLCKTQCQPDVITLNTVINGFCKMGRVEEALKVLDDMVMGKFCAPDSVTYTTIICGLLNLGRSEEALDVLRRVMPEKGFKPGVVTFNAVLHGLFKLQQANVATEVFNSMVSDGVAANTITYTIIIDGLFESDQIDEAKRFWDDVIWPSKVHDNFVYAAILKGLCRSGKLNEACDFLYELVDCGVTLNVVNYNILIDHACKLGSKREAYAIVQEMKKNGLTPDAVTWRILHKLHGNVGK